MSHHQIQSRYTLFSSLFAFLAATVLIAGCQKSSSEGEVAQAPKEMANQDLAKFAEIPQSALAEYDAQVHGQYSRVFGGTTPQHLIHFFNERIHHIWAEEDTHHYTITPGRFIHTSWSRIPNQPSESNKGSARGVVAATNLSMMIWFQGALDGVTPVISDGTRSIPIDSSRVGIMVIGPGYKPVLTANDGTPVPRPRQWRQSVLLHEARHSDCNSGLSEADLEIARSSRDLYEFDERFEHKSCGHLHTLCPEGHVFHGLPACDKQAWGAYSVGALFASAVAPSMAGSDRAIMDAQVVDAWSRVLVDKDAMLTGKLGAPDVTSSGVRR